MAYTNSLNYEGPSALVALMDHAAGKSVPANITFPLPLVLATKGVYDPKLPLTSPGPEPLPQALLDKLLAT